MKKLLFRVIALVAFSGVSVAKAIEIEEIKSEEDPSTKGVDCVQWAVDKVNTVENTQGCLTPTQYTFYYNTYYNNCMRNKVLGIQP